MMLIKKDKVKFVPVKEVTCEADYTKVNDIKQLEWFVNPNKPVRSSSFMKAVKSSVETKIETQTIYFTDLENGRCGFVQLLYSTVMGGIYKGFQLNFKVFRSRHTEDEEEIDVWESFKLESVKEFKELKVVSRGVVFEFKCTDQDDLVAQLDIKVDIPKTATSTGVKIDLLVDLYEGFMVNPNGCNYYLEKSITREELAKKEIRTQKVLRHLFVPRVKCQGTISYQNSKNKEISFTLKDTPGLYIDAVQGLTPNKAAKRWNFLCYQDKIRSIICMEFTTIEEYNDTTVTVWCSTEHNKIASVGSSTSKTRVEFENTEKDVENGWYYPTSITFPMGFKEEKLKLVNRYDVMGELPYIVRSLAENIAKIKPFIYQYCQDSNYKGEEGISIIESTFIS